MEGLTTYILALVKSFDIRSGPAVRLLTETLEPLASAVEFPAGPEHFAHELYSFMRSPFDDLREWDDVTEVRQCLRFVSMPLADADPSTEA